MISRFSTVYAGTSIWATWARWPPRRTSVAVVLHATAQLTATTVLPIEGVEVR